MLGVEGRLAELGSAAKATLRDRSNVAWLVSPVAPELINGATIGGQVFGVPPNLAAPALPAYRASSVDVFVGPNGNRILSPGAYRSVTVHPNGRLRLSAEDYSFATLDLHSQSRLDLNKTAGPIRVVVNGTTKLQNSYNHTPAGATGFVLGSLTQQTVFVETPFRGTLVVPRGSLNLRAVNGVSHEGEFLAKDIKAEAGARVSHVAGACVEP